MFLDGRRGYDLRPWKVLRSAVGIPIWRPSVRQNPGENTTHRSGPAPDTISHPYGRIDTRRLGPTKRTRYVTPRSAGHFGAGVGSDRSPQTADASVRARSLLVIDT